VKRWRWWEKFLLGAFLFWSVAGLVFTLGRISPEEAAQWPVPPWLAYFIAGCISTGDPILILLAFANTHANAARQWGPARARRWALILLASSLALETLGVSTGLPFGDYRYTGRFGPMIGVVPLTIPLAWYVVVTNAFFLVGLVRGERSWGFQAALTALLCTIYDFVLEPFATTTKQYWIWQGGSIPLRNYAAWFVLSGLLAWFFAPRLETRYPRDIRPALIMGMTLLIFLSGR
jgi:putative membrane protein